MIVSYTVPCYYRALQAGPVSTCDRNDGKNCMWTLNCVTDADISSRLLVRNCGDFFVYKAQKISPFKNPPLLDRHRSMQPVPNSKPGIFCGTKDSLPKAGQYLFKALFFRYAISIKQK